jgi:hypothetical protein
LESTVEDRRGLSDPKRYWWSQLMAYMKDFGWLDV